MRPLKILLVAVVLAGCCVTKPKPGPDTISVRDSVVVHVKDSVNIVDCVVVRDSVVYVELPKEQSQNVLPKEMSSHLETSLAVSDAFVDTLGLLHHSLENKDESLPVHVPVTEHTTTTEQTSQKDSVSVHEDSHDHTEYVEREFTGWEKFRLDAFWWLIVLCLIGFRREIFAIIKKII